MNDLVLNSSLPTTDTTKFESYLQALGLPTQNIIAPTNERKIIESNLTPFLASLSPDVKKDARYLSKFVAGAAIGLFDASLNYIWNEVVVNLRNKVTVYGLDVFFDNAVGGDRREFYKTEDDLAGIKDNTLINTCKKLELISEIVYVKLHHILTMRNDIGSSHPNSYNINAFELLGWLQTCVQDILNDVPSDSAIQIKAFIENLKKSTTVLDTSTIKSMETPLNTLSLQNTDNLLNSIFGIYISDTTNNIIQKNISLFAPYIWERSSESLKYKIGIKIDGFKNNLMEDKYRRGTEFFNYCDGNRYLSLDTRIITLDSQADDLLEARYSWDNYHNEPKFIKKIMSFIKIETDIPVERMSKIIKIILICRLGKGISYQNGVAPMAKDFYDNFFKLLGDTNILVVIENIHTHEIKASLTNPICQDHMKNILEILKTNARSERIQEVLDYLILHIKNLSKIHLDKHYKDLTKPFFIID